MKNKYIEAVESGNIVRVRLSLSNELMLDPRGDSFQIIFYECVRLERRTNVCNQK